MHVPFVPHDIQVIPDLAPVNLALWGKGWRGKGKWEGGEGEGVTLGGWRGNSSGQRAGSPSQRLWVQLPAFIFPHRINHTDNAV